MAVELNHTIIWCRDNKASSAFLAEILGLPAPKTMFHFEVVALSNGVSLDFMAKKGEVARQHYAFLVSEPEFDAAFDKIKGRGLTYWADPARTRAGEMNHNDGGRGVYFDDPDGHVMEILTRPYGSGEA